jgi:hypothetical protein
MLVCRVRRNWALGSGADALNQPNASVMANLAYRLGIYCFWNQQTRMG